MRRLGGVLLFRSSRPSLSWVFPFWRPGLTFRRSRPNTAAAELKALDVYSALTLALPQRGGTVKKSATQAGFMA